MRKLIISLFFVSTSTLFAISTQTASMLRSADINLAQNARMKSEKDSDNEAILLNILKDEKRELQRDGIIYSLASIKSEKAFPQIVEMAKEGNTAAILALAKYEDKAYSTLKELGDTYPIAKNAAILASKEFPVDTIPTAKYFYTLSEKEQRKVLSNLQRKKGVMRFLDNITFPDPLVLMTTYSKLGENIAAEKIMELQEKYNLDISIDSPALRILSLCSHADSALTTAALQGNIYAIRALKNQRLEYAEAILIALSNDPDENLKKEAIEALSTCGSDKTLKAFAQVLPNADEKLLGLYVRTIIAIHKGLTPIKKKEFKAIFNKKLNSSSGKTKAAMERILAEIEKEPQE